MKKLISIVTPTFNEEDNIKELCQSIASELKKTNYDYEHIIIDNSSTDNTTEILRELAKQDKNIKVIINSRNFGHVRSPVHGLLQSKGDAAILMMSDFQDPIELIPQYISEWEKGYDVVLAQKNSSEENFIKHFLKNLFYKFAKRISDTPLLMNTTGSGLINRKILNILKKIEDPYPYFRGLIPEITENIKLISFHQPKRKKGKTKNNFYTLYDLGILGIVKHSKFPLRVMTFFGFIFSILSLLVALIYLIFKLIYWDSFELGVAPIIIGIFLLAFFQIF